MTTDGMPNPLLIELLKAGGLTLFAIAVWWEMRQQRIERAQRELEEARRDERLNNTLTLMHTTLEVIRYRAGFASGPVPALPQSAVPLPGEVPVVDPGRGGRPP